MLKALLSRKIDGFERTWNYDASYMRALLRGGLGSFLRFSMITGMVDRKAAPAEALAAAGIVGTIAEDCGPCTQISVDLAAAQGARPQVLKAILAGDEAAMGDTARLAFRFARASLARDMETCDPLREEIVRRWGERGLTAIALSLTTARLYPTVKYALGHGKACSRVTVAGEPIAVVHPPIAA